MTLSNFQVAAPVKNVGSELTLVRTARGEAALAFS